MTEQENLQKVRHSLAHLMAAAVLEFWPEAKTTIGPAIENGFYYDFDFPEKISEADVKKIEKKMRALLPSWQSFERIEVDESQARAKFKDNPYKLELIDEIVASGESITLYKSGEFTDLCRGGHVDNPSQEINPKAFKLDRMAGAYWRGDEKNKMLTRLYGLAFDVPQELEAYLKMREEAEKRDHKKLGRELDLFLFSDLVGPGLPLWTPKGTVLRNELDNFVWSLRKARGYQRVEIPHITKKDLYETSGHWDKFKDELFNIETREGHLFAMKPMNCPHHTQIYKRALWSYRDLPQRYANTTMCYRDEQTGELSGLSRVRSFTQDDAHVFCRYSQIEEEALKIWDIVDEFYAAFGFPLEVHLSLSDPEQPEKYLGDQKGWQEAEGILRDLAKNRGVKVIEDLGEAAFYGPKIDFIAKDSLGRQWQVATIQLDMNMPERFDLTCTNEKSEPERIVMIHAAIMGSIERFLSILIEHLAGSFPVWLAPVQVAILPISDTQNEYAGKIAQELKNAGLRVEVDDRSESIGKKIRENSLQKIPYLLIVGQKEVEAESMAVRGRGQQDLGLMSASDFLAKTEKIIQNKSLDLQEESQPQHTD